MWLFVTGVAVFTLPGAWALPRVRRELIEDGRITTPTFLAVFVAYVGHAAVTLLAAWRGAWPLPIPRPFALLAGMLLMVLGALIYLSGRVRFRSFRLTWGLDTSRLVTSGIYRHTRNPQTIGAILLQLGIALLGRSALAMLLVALLWLGSRIWLPIEERVLKERFGEEYAKYRADVPRYLGWGRRRLR